MESNPLHDIMGSYIIFVKDKSGEEYFWRKKNLSVV